MVPNLRFNKKLTKKLIKAIPKERTTSLLSIEWGYENTKDKIYGLSYDGLFKSTMFYLQQLDDEKYRLVVADGKPMCSFYLIDDIDKFLDIVGVEALDLEDNEMVRKALDDAIICPNTGILYIEDDEIFIYDHKNY